VHQMRPMKGLGRRLGLLTALAVLLLALLPAPANASCAPLSEAERAERAEVIAYGRVTAEARTNRTYYTVVLEQVFKGEPPNPIVIQGPGQVTSVDYSLPVDSDHTLYLKRNSKGYYTTDACAGSHPGRPTAAEAKLLGEGRPAPAPQFPREFLGLPIRLWIPLTAMAITAAAIGFVLLSVRREK
jgi:hypothetical protein